MGVMQIFKGIIFANSLLRNAQNALTAGTTQTIAGGTKLVNGINRVTTVTSAGDALTLPAAKRGASVIVFNKGAGNAMGVYPGLSTDAINAIAAGSPYSVASTKGVLFACAVDGTWDTLLTA